MSNINPNPSKSQGFVNRCRDNRGKTCCSIVCAAAAVAAVATGSSIAIAVAPPLILVSCVLAPIGRDASPSVEQEMSPPNLGSPNPSKESLEQ